MNDQADHGVPEDAPSGTNDCTAGPADAVRRSEPEPGAAQPIPEWAPPEPLPSSEMFLATFAGAQPVTAGDILNPAYGMVECQRDYRLAVEVLADTEAAYGELQAAAKTLVLTQADLDMLTIVIDDAVLARIALQRKALALASSSIQAPLDQPPEVPTHTESVGEIAAKLAELWERAVSKGADPQATATAEAHELAVLCDGYDCLAAEIESGQRTLPGM
ncbi:hypothetical protein [Nocardia thraciensis]